MTEKSAKPLRDSSDQVIGWCSSLVVAPLKHTLLSWERCFASIGVEMELRHLRYFVAVAEAGGLEGAARRKTRQAQDLFGREVSALAGRGRAAPLESGGRRGAQATAGREHM